MGNVSVEAFAEYIERVRTRSTALKYTQAVRAFLETLHSNGYASFERLPPGILPQYTQTLAEKGCSPQTIHWHMAGIQKYLDWVRGQGVSLPDLQPPDTPRQKVVIRDALPAEALPRYMELASELLTEPTRTAVMLMPCVGLRCSELVGLPLSALRRVQLPTKQVLSLRVVGKGGDARIVPVLDEGEEVLLSYLAGWRRGFKGSWVFPGAAVATRPMSGRALRSALSVVREHLGLYDLTPHTLRRTYAVTLHRRGVEATTIAKVMGHKDMKTLYRHYLALDEQDILRGVHARGTSLLQED